jgi:hypothetical protein
MKDVEKQVLDSVLYSKDFLVRERRPTRTGTSPLKGTGCVFPCVEYDPHELGSVIGLFKEPKHSG